MATKKPRITVTLEAHAHEVLSRLSAVGGESMSALVAQLVEVTVPSLERLVVVLERAAAAPKEAHAGLLAAVERAERTLLPALMRAQDMGDLFMADLDVAAATVPTPAPAKRGRAAVSLPVASSGDPRLVTRGSGGMKQARKGVRRGSI